MTVRQWAIAQLNAGEDVEDNLSRALAFLREAAEAGCSLIAFPEVFLYRGSSEGARTRGIDPAGPRVDRLREAARNHEIAIQAGSFLAPPEKDEDTDGDRLDNLALAIDREGEIVAEYRKIHLFDVDLPEVEIQESRLMRSGNEVVDGRVDGVHCGLSICYDLRFPELYRQLSSRGAEALFVPSNFTRETGRAHWEPLLRARAIENQAYVIAPNQIGPNPDTGIESLGQSLIVDPWGQVVVRMSDQVGWTSTRLDLSYLENIRRRLPSLNHRKLD